jgi:hypothetical protein
MVVSAEQKNAFHGSNANYAARGATSRLRPARPEDDPASRPAWLWKSLEAKRPCLNVGLPLVGVPSIYISSPLVNPPRYVQSASQQRNAVRPPSR